MLPIRRALPFAFVAAALACSSPQAGPRPSGGAEPSAGTGPVTQLPAETQPGSIQYIGRWDASDAANPSGSWGPIGIRARFEGTSVRVKLNDPKNTFTYSVDGGAPQLLSPGTETEPLLASGLADGEHTLELYRRSEGAYGKTVVSGLVLDPSKRLLSPPPRAPRKLEVLGDSISAGYGNEGMGGTTPATQNGYLAYGPQLARLLNAEWSIVAHSGQGVYRNLCEALPPTQRHMPDEFLLTQHPAVPGPTWDFNAWQPDVLIVALGTNDFSDYPPGTCQPPDVAAFAAAYAALLGTARERYPAAELFALGTFLAAAGNAFGAANQKICEVVTALGDAHVHCIDPGTGPEGAWLVGPDDYIGDWTHPTVAAHTKLAQQLAGVIRPVMGW